MSTSVSWNNSTRSIPSASERRWSSLSLFLIDLANNAQTTNKQIMGIRTATSSPVTVTAATDYTVVTNLSVAGAVAVNLPAGVNGQTFVIIDGKGDAGTNTITISGNGGQTIGGSSSYLINTNYGSVELQWSSTENTWMILSAAAGGGGGGSPSFPVRTATSSPVTVANTDFTVMSNLSVAGAVTVNLPAGTDGKIFAIVDAKGDASTNNITITPASGNINGASTYVINRNKGGVLIQYNTTETEWKILSIFTNEIFTDTGFTIKDSSDATKLVKFDVAAAQTTGTTTTLTLPPSTDTLAGIAATQTLSNKTEAGAKVSDYKDYAEVASPSTPASGYVRVYAKSDNKMYQKDDGGVESLLGGSGSGSGEINAITNPSAATDTTGWTAATNYTVARDTSNSPLSPITSSCLSLTTTTASSESSTSGIYFPISATATGLRNRKLKIEVFFTSPASSAGTWVMSYYNGSTRAALSTDSSSVTTIPAGVTGGKFTAYVDTDSSSTASLNFTQTSRSSSNTLYITNVIVGPGIQPQGAVVGSPKSVTFTGTWVSNTTYTAFETREGEWASYVIKVAVSGAPTSAALVLTLPTGRTINTAALPNTTADQSNLLPNSEVGILDSGTVEIVGGVQYASSTTVAVLYTNDAAAGVELEAVTQAAPMTFASGDSITISFRVPIAEWAGSGTANLAQNDVEYAYTSGTWDADDTTTSYGPGGATMGGALTSARTKTVTWLTPVQSTDTIELEFGNTSNNNWVSGGVFAPYQLSSAGTNATSGGSLVVPGSSSATTTVVVFCRYNSIANDDSPTNDWGATTKWRLVKRKAGIAVGFGIVSENSSGLVPSTNTNLDNASATRLGLKVYQHGTTYNGGVAPTVTLSSGGGSLSSVDLSTFIPYQTQSGSWRLRASVSITVSSTSRGNAAISINGVAFSSSAPQAASGYANSTSAFVSRVITATGTGQIDIQHTAAITTAAYYYSGDFALDSKPTWAY